MHLKIIIDEPNTELLIKTLNLFINDFQEGHGSTGLIRSPILICVSSVHTIDNVVRCVILRILFYRISRWVISTKLDAKHK